MRLASLLLLVVLATARAEAVGDAGEEREARVLHEEATRHFHRGDYDRAITAYKQAYVRAPAPALLFNIAQAYRAKHDSASALAYYDAYLRADPESAERRFVEARIAELRGVQVAPDGTPLPLSMRPVGDRPGKPGLRTAGAVTAGLGALMAGAGVVFTVQAHGRVGSAVESGDGAGVKSAQGRAIVFTTVGLAAMVTGGAMFYAGSQPLRVGPVVGPGAAGLQVNGAF